MKIKIFRVIVSLIISRTLFLLVDDPEGPNLLIVVVLAIGIYGVLSFAHYFLIKRHNIHLLFK